MTAADALTRLFQERGNLLACGANAPLLLEDPSMVWLVTEGRLDVFAVRVAGDWVDGARDYLFSIPAGGLVLGMEPEWAAEVGLLAVGMPGTQALGLPLEVLQGVGSDAGVPEALDRYITAFSSALAARSSPRFDFLLSPGESLEVPEAGTLSSRRGVVWAEFETSPLLFDGQEELSVYPEEGPFPLSSGAWARAGGATPIRGRNAESLEADALWLGLRTFQRVALEWADLVLERDRGLERERLKARVRSDQEAGRGALELLAGVITPDPRGLMDPSGGPLLTACNVLGEVPGIRFSASPRWEKTGGTLTEELRSICRASAVGFRKVVLEPEWWTRDSGPLLGFSQGKGVGENHDSGDGTTVPVALLRQGGKGYVQVDPLTGRRTPVDAEVAGDLFPFGYQFYRSLPEGRVTLGDLWRFVTFGAWGDFRTLAATGLLGAFLGLLLPVLTGVVFDWIIPSSVGGQMVNVFVALLVATLASATFAATRAFAVIRLHARVSADLQLAVLDRLTRLPIPFFRRFTAGDLGVRAGGIGQIGSALSGATVNSLMASMTSAGAYVLLFVYSPTLALLATLILLVNMAFTGVTARYALRFAREREEADGTLSGLVLQLLTGIGKLRVAGAEIRVFARWVREFRRKREVAHQLGRYRNNVQVFHSVLSIAATLALYWAYTALAESGDGALTTGRFLAFNAAFGMFMSGGLSVMGVAMELLELVPLWERARPILDQEPEADPGRPDPGELTGRIEISHLTFRYRKDGPVILQDVSVEADPGEFVALVGPSGAGKSTLLRVLLAFDLPESSSVYYDGQDLATVDVTAIRKQIGVVLQSSKLTAGTIHSNILGASELSQEAVWEAIRMAGLEEDIRDMPMGLHTVVSEGGGTLSGGQRQRLLIARAIVHRPRILFFDEATSSLDNRTQEIVSESLERLHTTRIVIAHRISTIQNADRIYVLDQGKVVQRGGFRELMDQPGLFRELALRQEV